MSEANGDESHEIKLNIYIEKQSEVFSIQITSHENIRGKSVLNY